jgi:hypothetical protein
MNLDIPEMLIIGFVVALIWLWAQDWIPRHRRRP